jgi:acetyl esterase/lipase
VPGDPAPRIEPYGDHESQFVAVWEPVDAEAPPSPPRATVVLIHGGYWRDRYGLDLMDPMAAHLASHGFRAVNIEYRRVGERSGVWAEMSADVMAAVALAGDQPEPVIVIGHSAGGHLALWVASTPARVDAVIALAPVADLEEADRRSLSRGAVRELLGGGRSTVPELYREASPQRLVPLGRPQLVVHGTGDDNVPLDLATAYVAAAEAAGDRVELLTPPRVDHFDVIDPDHEIWRTIDDRLDRFATTRTGDGAGSAGP